MHPMVARSFLNMQLSQSERVKLRAYEKRLPPGRYLQGFEICQWLSLSPKPVLDFDTTAMESLWNQYAKFQLNKSRSLEDQKPEEKPLTKQEEIHAWEDWALQNFQMPNMIRQETEIVRTGSTEKYP